MSTILTNIFHCADCGQPATHVFTDAMHRDNRGRVTSVDRNGFMCEFRHDMEVEGGFCAELMPALNARTLRMLENAQVVE